MRKNILTLMLLIIPFSCFGVPQSEEGEAKNITINDCSLYLKSSDFDPIILGGSLKEIWEQHRISTGPGFLKANQNEIIGLIPKTSYRIAVRKSYIRYYASHEGTLVYSTNNEIVELISTVDKRYKTLRGLHISDMVSKIVSLYGQPAKKYIEPSYSVFEYWKKIDHQLFREIVLSFKVEKEIVT